VLSIRQDRLAYRFTQPTSEANAYGEDLSDVPYAAYATKVAALFPRIVRGLREGSRVLGVVVKGHAKAYPVSQIRARIATADVLGGEPILVTFDDGAYAARVLARRLDGRLLTFRVSGNRLLDGETGSRWTLAGEAEAGPLKGRRLRLLPSTFSYWFAWRRFHPAGEIFAARGDRTSDGGNVDRQ
jgi:hypothetical protein